MPMYQLNTAKAEVIHFLCHALPVRLDRTCIHIKHVQCRLQVLRATCSIPVLGDGTIAIMYVHFE